MIALPDVTLVMIDTRTHDLARLAIADCLRHVNFGDVLICTDHPERYLPLGRELHFVRVPNWPTKIEWSWWSWFGLPSHVRTSHALTIQWDSWIWDPAQWDDDFLRYDIVGAPWDWHREHQVGNLGFGLRSTRLMQYVAELPNVFPCTTDADDALLCRTYRPALERVGFKWAPVDVARRFSFECTPLADGQTSFGFHAAFNFHRVLDPPHLAERQRLMEHR